MRPSQLAGPASQPSPPPPSSSWRQSARRVAGARARPPRHATCSPACLPSPPRSVSPDDATPPPCSLSLSPGSPSLSLSPGRTPPSPPFALAAVSDHPSLPRPAQELRHDSLVLSAKSCLAGRPVETSPSPSSPPAAADRHRRFVVSSASPATTSSLQVLYEPCFFSHLFPGRARPLAVVPTMAEPSPPPSSPSTQLR